MDEEHDSTEVWVNKRCRSPFPDIFWNTGRNVDWNRRCTRFWRAKIFFWSNPNIFSCPSISSGRDTETGRDAQKCFQRENPEWKKWKIESGKGTWSASVHVPPQVSRSGRWAMPGYQPTSEWIKKWAGLTDELWARKSAGTPHETWTRWKKNYLSANMREKFFPPRTEKINYCTKSFLVDFSRIN